MTRTEALEVGNEVYYRTIFTTSEGTMVKILTKTPPELVVELTGEEAVREVERERAERTVA